MFENISILVPYKSDNGLRDRNWAWLERRYREMMPEAEICFGQSTTRLFSRSDAINNAARIATREIFIIADSDICFNMEQIEKGLSMLNDYEFVIPFSHLIRLGRHLSDTLISCESTINMTSIDSTNCKVDVGTQTFLLGGIGIIKKTTFFQCGGFDPRFQGWGGEDDAFGAVIRYFYGKIGRPDDTYMWHLFHESQPMNNYFLKRNGQILNREYFNSTRIPSMVKYLKRLNKF